MLPEGTLSRAAKLPRVGRFEVGGETPDDRGSAAAAAAAVARPSGTGWCEGSFEAFVACELPGETAQNGCSDQEFEIEFSVFEFQFVLANLLNSISVRPVTRKSTPVQLI